MIIKILSKDDTLKIISDEKFISTWEHLAENTNHCTIMQEYGFVVSWYRSYLDKYKPMMLLGYDEEERQVSDVKRVIGDYYGWIITRLSLPGIGKVKFL